MVKIVIVIYFLIVLKKNFGYFQVNFLNICFFCLECDCGENLKSCYFKGLIKVCTCNKGYAQLNKTCAGIRKLCIFLILKKKKNRLFLGYFFNIYFFVLFFHVQNVTAVKIRNLAVLMIQIKQYASAIMDMVNVIKRVQVRENFIFFLDFVDILFIQKNISQ